MVLHQCLPPAAHPGCMYESLPADRMSTVCPSALAAPLSLNRSLRDLQSDWCQMDRGFYRTYGLPIVCVCFQCLIKFKQVFNCQFQQSSHTLQSWNQISSWQTRALLHAIGQYVPVPSKGKQQRHHNLSTFKDIKGHGRAWQLETHLRSSINWTRHLESLVGIRIWQKVMNGFSGHESGNINGLSACL